MTTMHISISRHARELVGSGWPGRDQLRRLRVVRSSCCRPTRCPTTSLPSGHARTGGGPCHRPHRTRVRRRVTDTAQARSRFRHAGPGRRRDGVAGDAVPFLHLLAGYGARLGMGKGVKIREPSRRDGHTVGADGRRAPCGANESRPRPSVSGRRVSSSRALPNRRNHPNRASRSRRCGQPPRRALTDVVVLTPTPPKSSAAVMCVAGPLSSVHTVATPFGHATASSSSRKRRTVITGPDTAVGE